jgi:hypothetical protein
VIKTLKDPPEIWDVVHEVPRNFNARSAFLTRIQSVKWPVAVGAFAVLLFVVAGGAGVFLSRSSKARNVSVRFRLPFRLRLRSRSRLRRRLRLKVRSRKQHQS